MRILGLNKLTLIDYPQKVAATIFTGGCNFRCPFCHNASLVENPDFSAEIPQSEVLEYLEKRKNVLDGVCVTGGEPLIYNDIDLFLQKLKNMGYLVKLDTNGSFPGKLEQLVNEGLVDYVAMDIKNSLESYGATIGIENYDTTAIERSADFLMSEKNKAQYEFRTTVVEQLHNHTDFENMASRFAGAKIWHLQSFADSGDILVQGLSAPSKEKMEQYRGILANSIADVRLREMK